MMSEKTRDILENVNGLGLQASWKVTETHVAIGTYSFSNLQRLPPPYDSYFHMLLGLGMPETN